MGYDLSPSGRCRSLVAAPADAQIISEFDPTVDPESMLPERRSPVKAHGGSATRIIWETARPAETGRRPAGAIVRRCLLIDYLRRWPELPTPKRASRTRP